MGRIEEIIEYIDENGNVSGSQIADELGISRQAVHRYLKILVLRGEVTKIGKTKGTVYSLKKSEPEKVKKTYALDGLKEDEVFEEMNLRLRLRSRLSGNSYSILNYAFTEMLNNAVEHSQSKICDVIIILDSYNCHFIVRDFGIGLFHNLAEKFALVDETAAIVELSKGKRTTMKETHSGEGIFFTSKVGDVIKFRSHKTSLVFDNTRVDVFFTEEKRYIKGTEVSFSISMQSKRKLEDVFAVFAPEDYDSSFVKTSVCIKLLLAEYISRSEARRLLVGLDKFREVILDFKDVRTIGQGFADEVFRVFANTHPEIMLKRKNVKPMVEAMIQHVINTTT